MLRKNFQLESESGGGGMVAGVVVVKLVFILPRIFGINRFYILGQF